MVDIIANKVNLNQAKIFGQEVQPLTEICFIPKEKEFKIVASKLPKVKEKIQKYNKECIKKGIPLTTFEDLGTVEEEVKEYGFVSYCLLKVNYSVLKINGWLKAGRIYKSTEETNESYYDYEFEIGDAIVDLREPLTKEEEEVLRVKVDEQGLKCDDCLVKRCNPRRKFLYVFKKDQDFKFCGSTCAKDYLGSDRLLWQLKYIEEGERNIFSHGDKHYENFEDCDIVYRIPRKLEPVAVNPESTETLWEVGRTYRKWLLTNTDTAIASNGWYFVRGTTSFDLDDDDDCVSFIAFIPPSLSGIDKFKPSKIVDCLFRVKAVERENIKISIGKIFD